MPSHDVEVRIPDKTKGDVILPYPKNITDKILKKREDMVKGVEADGLMELLLGLYTSKQIQEGAELYQKSMPDASIRDILLQIWKNSGKLKAPARGI